MKHLLSTLAAVLVINSWAADLIVTPSGAPGTYATISSAVSAAVDGDRLIISPSVAFIENVTIDKSLTLISSIETVRFIVAGDILFEGAPNREVTILGSDFSSLVGNTGTSNDYSCKLNIIDCIIDDINIEQFIWTKALYNVISGTTIITDGKIVANDFGNNFTVNNAQGAHDTIKIIANIFRTRAEMNTDDRYFFISNNYFSYTQSYCLRFNKFLYSPDTLNVISNNTIRGLGSSTSSSSIYFAANTATYPNASNFLIINNLIYASNSNGYTLYCTLTSNLPKAFHNWVNNISTARFEADQITGNIAGAFVSANTYGQGSGLAIDGGFPGIEYYDIDLTPNDIGTYGGSYTMENYWNTLTGRARIYDLDIPFEIFNGATPEIKAESTHMK